MRLIALTIMALALGGCYEKGESTTDLGTFAEISEHRVVASDKAVYRCFVYRAYYKGGLWCEGETR